MPTKTAQKKRLTRNHIVTGVLLATVVALVVVLWLNHRATQSARDAAADLQSERDRRLCSDFYNQLHHLRFELPRYEKHVRAVHRPEHAKFGPYYLLGASKDGLYYGLRFCLRARDEHEEDEARLAVLWDFLTSDTVDQTRRLIDELAEILRERYGFREFTYEEGR